MTVDTRRAEVLEIAASLIATAGLRTSMHEIAGAAGIQTGSLYHHFESKEARLVELLRPNPSMEFAKRIRQIKSLLSAGIRSGDIKVDSIERTVPLEMLARCVIVLRWIPASILGQLGTRAALIHVRDTMLRGVTLA